MSNKIDLGCKDPKYMNIPQTAIYNRKKKRIANLKNLRIWLKTNRLRNMINERKFGK